MKGKLKGHINDDEFQSLTFSIDGASFYLNAYCNAIKEDKGIQD